MQTDKPGNMLLASSTRASRAANPPTPTNLAVATEIARGVANMLEAMNLIPHPDPPSARLTLSEEAGVKRAKRSHADSHLLSLHARELANLGGEPVWSSFFSQLPLYPHGVLFSAGIRSSSVRVTAVIEKAKNLSGEKMAGSMQSTRVSTQSVTAAWSVDATACLVALGVANYDKADPRATGALSPMKLLGSAGDNPHVVASTATSLANALATRLVPTNLLHTMTDIAQAELSYRLISLKIQQETTSCLRDMCERIVDNRGDLVWACFALLTYLAAEARGREIIRRFPISDMDIAAAEALLNYGRSEITRRARLTDAQLVAEEEQRRCFGEHTDDPEPEKGTFVGEMLRLQRAEETASEPSSEETELTLEATDDDLSSDEELSNMSVASPSTPTTISRNRSSPHSRL